MREELIKQILGKHKYLLPILPRERSEAAARPRRRRSRGQWDGVPGVITIDHLEKFSMCRSILIPPPCSCLCGAGGGGFMTCL